MCGGGDPRRGGGGRPRWWRRRRRVWRRRREWGSDLKGLLWDPMGVDIAHRRDREDSVDLSFESILCYSWFAQDVLCNAWVKKCDDLLVAVPPLQVL